MTLKELLKKVSLAKSQNVQIWFLASGDMLPEAQVIPSAKLRDAMYAPEYAQLMEAKVMNINATTFGLTVTVRMEAAA